MSRDYKVYLQDILEAIRKIQNFTKGISKNSFLSDEKTFDAVIRNLEIIGEAIKNIPDHVRNNHHKIEWRKIAGLRDVLIHEYFGIDEDIVWEIIEDKLPHLKRQIQEILKK